MWQEATEQAANMLAMRPYPGFQGRWFDMPCRNLVPKPVQKPHPPIWVACSRRETIHRAARNGLGALAFAFLEPEQAAKWVEEYYNIIKSPECVPIGHSLNPNLAIVTGMSCHPDEAEAVASTGRDGPTSGSAFCRSRTSCRKTPGAAASARPRNCASI
jgi:alkanesulfonate monooxygenase SsuD/methylene tetrahydromethanopterin reductase-like flavin-dependent oxidoreductase (luciferase family)